MILVQPSLPDISYLPHRTDSENATQDTERRQKLVDVSVDLLTVSSKKAEQNRDSCCAAEGNCKEIETSHGKEEVLVRSRRKDSSHCKLER